MDLATERLVASGPGAAHRRKPAAEPDAPAETERRQTLSVSRPQVLLGIKDAAPGASGRALLVRETVTEALLDVLFGDGGTVEAPLHEEGLVDDSFGASYQAEPDGAFVSVSAEVDAERPYRDRLLEAIEAARRAGVKDADVERSRRKAIGSYLRTFNSPERVASLHLGLHMKDASASDLPAALEAVTTRAVSERLEDLLSRARAWSVVVPREGPPSPAGPAASGGAEERPEGSADDDAGA
jgi:predicted Zn-dependent peptidase